MPNRPERHPIMSSVLSRHAHFHQERSISSFKMSNDEKRAAATQAANDDDEPDEWCAQLMEFGRGKAADRKWQGQENLQHRLLRCVTNRSTSQEEA